jgi:hypothetical protein
MPFSINTFKQKLKTHRFTVALPLRHRLRIVTLLQMATNKFSLVTYLPA